MLENHLSDIDPDLPKTCSLEECRVAVIGEAPGADEVKEERPFVGMSGRLLRKTMLEAGLDPDSVYISNVFHKRPPDNAIMWFFDKKDGEVDTNYPPFDGKYIKKEWTNQLERLRFELFHLNPEVILCVGRTPLWALLNKTGITSLRGRFYPATGLVNLPHIQVMPTFHPAYCLRNRNNIKFLREDIEKVVALIAH